MSLAAFVFYAKKHGFDFEMQGNNYLSFHYSGGRYYPSKIMSGKCGVDCGYIVVNQYDFDLLFGTDEEYIKDLKQSVKLKPTRSNTNAEHCFLPESLWGKIETKISPEIFINCLRKPSTP
jgi:hypothetical protein